MARYVPKETALANPLRRTLLELVGARPGITLTQLAQELRCQPSTVLWHTGKLAKADLLRSERVGNARVYYLMAGGTPLRNEIVGRVRLASDLARRVHDVVAERPGITFQGICGEVAANASSLRWHVRRLVANGLLCRGQEPGRVVHYYTRGRPPQGAPCLAEASAA